MNMSTPNHTPAAQSHEPQNPLNALNALEIRADFPIFEHRPKMVFLDSAASSQKPRQVIETLRDFYAHDYANIHRGAYRLSVEATDRFEAVREQVARFFGVVNATGNPITEGVIFTRGATEAVNLVAYSWGLKHLNSGDVVLVSEMEHHANLVPWHLVTQLRGARVQAVRMTPDGQLDLEDYAEKLQNPAVKFVALQHVSNALGTIHPAQQFVQMAHARGVPILLDGAQAVPHLKVDFAALGADFYVLSAHKMLGPSGVGCLLACPERLAELPPFMGGGDMIREVHAEWSNYAPLPSTFEAGTPPVAEVIGMGAALEYLEKIGLENVHAHEQQLWRYALQQLRELQNAGSLELYGPAGRPELWSSSEMLSSGVISFNLKNTHAHDTAGFLDEAQVCVRAGHHCAQPLMRALDLESTVRASFYIYNTRADVDALVSELKETAEFFMLID